MCGETPAAQEFLRSGNLDLDFQQVTPPETITLLKHMKSFPVRIPRVNTTITTDDYKNFFGNGRRLHLYRINDILDIGKLW